MRQRIVAGASLLLVATANLHAAPLRVRSKIVVRGVVPDDVLAGAMAEAARVWAPYDVLLQWADASEEIDIAGGAMALTVLIDEEPTAAEGEDGVGAIRFGQDGAPASTVSVHYNPVKRLALSTQAFGTSASLWPDRLRTEAIGRALGRALAHEVGHFLLQWSHHATSGLMRADHRASALTDPSLKAFALTDVDRARLQVVMHAREMERDLRAQEIERPPLWPLPLASN